MGKRINGNWIPVLLLWFTGQAMCANSISLQISTENAPAGGWAQIKIYAVKPMAIASGYLVLNLDSTAFGPGTTVGLFGANGDASGLASLTGSQVKVQFSSPSGGIGQLAGLPVMVFSVPVLASVAGRTLSVTATATSPDLTVSVASGSVTVQGTLSVSKIPAGMGVVPAGTVVPVTGTGFTASTTVAINGVEIASTQFVSPQEVDVTLGGAAELVGKLARVRDGDAEFDYFCFQLNDPVNFPEITGFGPLVDKIQPLFPLFASTGYRGYTGEFGGVIEVQNPNPAAATVVLTNTPNCCGPLVSGTPNTLSIPPGSWAIFDGGDDSNFLINASLPVRVISLQLSLVQASLGTVTPYDENTLGPTAPVTIPSSLAFEWQAGAAAPGSRPVVVFPNDLSVVTMMTPTTASGGSWLSVSSPTASPGGGTFSVSVDPPGLTVGGYQGTILVQQSYGPPATLPVSLTVTASAVPMISASSASLSFSATTFTSTPYLQTIALTSDSGPAAFTVALQPGTWLKVSPLSGTTPATLTVTWDPAATAQIYYQQRSTPGSFLISGPGNAITIPATFNVTGVQTFQTFLGASGAGPNGLVFSAQTGSPSQTQTINVDPAGTITATADQTWMTAASPTTATVTVTANPAGVAPGVYHGTVTIGEAGLAPIAIPVVLAVWSSPPPLTVSTNGMTFVAIIGESGPPFQNAQVTSGGVPVPFTIAIGGSWLGVTDSYSAPTPTQLVVGIDNLPGPPGQYNGSFTLQSPGSSAYVPVTLLVEPGPFAPLVVSQVVNAASGIAGGLSPGEIVSIRGYGTGASAVSGLKLNPSGMVVSELNGLQVTFDGKPAPLLYTSANQTNVIVPYEVTNQTSTAMQVVYAATDGTLQTAAWSLPVVPSAPGIFTLDSTGTGQGAILNQDGSVNSAANPGPRGSVISIYATGEGQTSPAGVTGSVTQSNTITPLLPVTVTIGGISAAVQYSGSAPGEVAGVLQVNAVVPPGVAPAPALPVTVSVGGVASQAGVTVAVN